MEGPPGEPDGADFMGEMGGPPDVADELGDVDGILWCWGGSMMVTCGGPIGAAETGLELAPGAGPAKHTHTTHAHMEISVSICLIAA